jgi:hypothetical protein
MQNGLPAQTCETASPMTELGYGLSSEEHPPNDLVQASATSAAMMPGRFFFGASTGRT